VGNGSVWSYEFDRVSGHLLYLVRNEGIKSLLIHKMGESVTTPFTAAATRHIHCRNNRALNQHTLFAFEHVARDLDFADSEWSVSRTANHFRQIVIPSRHGSLSGNVLAFFFCETLGTRDAASFSVVNFFFHACKINLASNACNKYFACMTKLPTQKRAAVLRCLIEGNSILATSRITGAAKNTIVNFLAEAGEACGAYQDEKLTALPCRVLQLDEIWSFVGCKEKSKKKAIDQHPGDVWTWTAICAETKLIPSWRVGDRSHRTAFAFCHDLSKRFTETLQITSDGHPAYKWAIGGNFEEVNFAQLIKIYGKDEDGKDVVIRTERQPIFGTPNIDLVSTSYVERSNLSLRMGNRRFTRLTNAFSKKLENHCHMLALSFMHYNFCRKHTTVKTAPAVAAGVTDHIWTLDEVVEMIDAYFARKLEAEFERAFDMKVTPLRTTPKTYAPQAPRLPWYLDPESGGNPNPELS